MTIQYRNVNGPKTSSDEYAMLEGKNRQYGRQKKSFNVALR